MDKKIFIVGGCKGGVGKSIVASAFIDYLTQLREEKVYLVESDTSNPDVGKAYLKPERMEKDNRILGDPFDLDNAEGWINLVNAAGENPDSHIVINTAARNNKGVAAYGNLLAESLQDLKRDVVTFWVINRQKDSIELCDSYLKAVHFGVLYIIINGYFGERQKFQLYDSSKIKEEVERKGKSLYFPELADRVADMMRNNRLSVAEALETLPIGERAELKRWRNEYKKMFEAAGLDDGSGD
jgi:hypothetical protein